MLVDDVGEVTITNDGATILNLLDIKDLAAELLKKGDNLVKDRIHPNTVLAGYKLACKVALKWMRDNLTVPSADLGEAGL